MVRFGYNVGIRRVYRVFKCLLQALCYDYGYYYDNDNNKDNDDHDQMSRDGGRKCRLCVSVEVGAPFDFNANDQRHSNV